MPKIDNFKFYSNAIKKHGFNAKGVNWLSKETQELRFDEILQLLPDALSESSLGDAGCGFGDFYHYLVKQDKKPKYYTGIDSLLKMVHLATTKTQEEILHLDICKETLPIKDYYICSGALNILTTFETHLFIQNCYKSSRKSFIFNTLYGDKQSNTYNYMQKNEIENIAKRLEVRKIVYREDYIENDITVMFLK
ncbi:class I SAM-dependent methyltransferase [Sulfurimonas sp. SAG-AH-194-L11]|nr:class I SAM-dependent methyltransferase [Sulfurimonas sp. SAG-AH-194-L11]MDF1877743.1 class I SAM-dependent methyltransferase [Sulfurimonas sp. SAG-AH-194-L11]